MQNYNDSSIKSSPPAPPRWRAERLFPKPALSRRDILDRRSVAQLTDGDRAYLEAYNILSVFPGQLEAIYQGLADAGVEMQGERAS